MEARDFHDLFGADIATVSMVWNMLWEDGIHPKKSKPKHLVWMLYLLKIKIYPNHGMCGGIMHPEGSPSWPFAGTESLVMGVQICGLSNANWYHHPSQGKGKGATVPTIMARLVQVYKAGARCSRDGKRRTILSGNWGTGGHCGVDSCWRAGRGGRTDTITRDLGKGLVML